MKKFLLFFSLFLLLPLVISCGDVSDFSIPDTFSCQIEGSIEGKPFSAMLEGGTLRYLSPESLEGITLSFGGNELSLGELSLPSTLHGFSLPLALLFGEYELTGSGTGEYEGKLTRFLTQKSQNGLRRVWLSENGAPLAVSGSHNGLRAEFTINPQTESVPTPRTA